MDIEKITDNEAVVLTLKDKKFFRILVQRYEKPLRRYIIRLGASEVDDVLQDIFLKCYVNLNGYDRDLKFSSWLYRIAHNETISNFRKKKIRPSVIASTDDLAMFDDIPSPEDLLSELSRKFDGRIVREALQQVELKYREVVILRFFEERNYAEIADILEVPEGTVATFLNRGKKELRAILSNNDITI